MHELVRHNSYNKILVIEDNPGDARLVEIYLQESGLFQFEMVHRVTLAEGIEALKEGNFAAVLLDMNLPDSRGFITLENLLNSSPEENVILLTGTSDKDLGVRAIKAGAQDYLVKGEYDPELLAKTLKYSIERNRIIKRLEEAQRITHIGHWDYDLNSGHLEVSDEVFRIFGGTAINTTNLSYEYFLSLVHPDDTHLLKNVFSRLEKAKEIGQDMRILLKDETIRYVSVLARVTKREGGKVSRLAGVVQDITERKLAEHEIIKRKQRYEIIYNQSKDAIYISTITGEFVDFNTATLDLFGYSKEELIAMGTSSLYPDGEIKQRFQKELEETSFVHDFEMDLVRKDKSIRNCLVTASMIVTDEFTGYHSIIRDITEHKQAEMLREEKEIAQRSAKLKEKFLANVSHEMRTPMNAIIGMSHLLLKTDLNDEQYNYINSIRQSSENLLGIINNILDIAKSQHEDIVFEKADFDLTAIISNLTNVLQVQTDAKGLGLEVAVEDNVPTELAGDHLRLNQILINLTGNAIKFTDKGMVGLHIKNISESDENVVLRFEVTDTGIGMTEDQLQVIFEPFTRVASNKDRLYEGTGLGLSIIKRFVELQGGKLYVSSELGVGSVFGFDLEFEKSQPKLIEIEEEQDLSLPENQDINILVVEDNFINQTVAKNTIKKQWPQVHVEVADNGKIAIEKFNNNNYDLILMDIQMPVMDGEEATRYIRTHFSNPKRSTPIIAMTAHVFVKSDKKFLECGMDDCVLIQTNYLRLLLNMLKTNNPLIKQSLPMEKVPLTYRFIDLSYLELMSDGDIDMKGVLLEMLLVEPGEEIKKMKEFEAQKDYSELKKVSHKLKTTFPYIGYVELTEANKKIDRQLWKWNESEESVESFGDEIQQLVQKVDDMYQEALVELKTEFSRLKTSAV